MVGLTRPIRPKRARYLKNCDGQRFQTLPIIEKKLGSSIKYKRKNGYCFSKT